MTKSAFTMGKLRTPRATSHLPRLESVDSSVSRKFPLLHLKIRASLTQFTNSPLFHFFDNSVGDNFACVHKNSI
jgi:hypothetical protein